MLWLKAALVITFSAIFKYSCESAWIKPPVLNRRIAKNSNNLSKRAINKTVINLPEYFFLFVRSIIQNCPFSLYFSAIDRMLKKYYHMLHNILSINKRDYNLGRRWPKRPPPPNGTARTGQVSRSSINSQIGLKVAIVKLCKEISPSLLNHSLFITKRTSFLVTDCHLFIRTHVL